MPISEFHKGFIAGLLVGHGSFTGDRDTPRLGVKLNDDDPQPLITLSKLLGGTIYGPYRRGHRQYSYWVLRGRHLTDAISLFDAILPPCRKREHYHIWKQRYGLQTPPTGPKHSGGINQFDL